MLTPEDIQSREFLVSLRGYDRDEVHAFLDEIAEEFARLLGEDPPAPTAPAKAEEVAAPEPEPEPEPEPSALTSFAAIGAETQRILEAAHEAAEAIRARATEEAQAIKDDRIAEAEGRVAALEAEAATINSQIADLTSRREELGDRLRQAREVVDLALLEIEPPAAEPPADATTSVLAAGEEAEADAVADEPAGPARARSRAKTKTAGATSAGAAEDPATDGDDATDDADDDTAT